MAGSTLHLEYGKLGRTITAIVTYAGGEWTAVTVSYSPLQRTTLFFVTTRLGRDTVYADTVFPAIAARLGYEKVPTERYLSYEYFLGRRDEWVPQKQGNRRIDHALFHLARAVQPLLEPHTFYVPTGDGDWLAAAVRQATEFFSAEEVL